MNTLKKYDEIYESGYLEIEENSSFNFGNVTDIYFPKFEQFYKNPATHFNNIIISDIHLGSKLVQTDLLISFLKNISFDRLIINGDVFDSINMKRLSKHHWKVLSLLRKITDGEKKKEVIWIRGNHDGYSDLLTQLLGIEVFNEYMFEWNDKKILVLHGDIFDVYTSKHPIISELADIIYKFAIFIDPKKNRVGKFLKKNTKAFLRNAQIVKERSLIYGKHKHADIVCCGHTHYPDLSNEKNMLYLNSGSWTTHPTHFIGFTNDEVNIVPFTFDDMINLEISNSKKKKNKKMKQEDLPFYV